MPWVQFTSKHEWRVPGKRAVRTFQEGAKENVPRACADDAEAKGNGYRTEGRSKSETEATPEPETSEVFLTDEAEDQPEDAPKKQSMFGKLTGTADRDAG
ncbi:hypothetical protein [Henriciella aquimarina]|uniref:hypothetical protein n=1 Tax=Henriciella aquimarina TaxID=545261 RepID=UPI0009FEB2F6|nr:hypothetical protein [Henriciella aquimarina]